MRPVAELLAPLADAPQGSFAVLGNHDDDRDMPAALAQRGSRSLKDQRTRITIRNEPVDLVGIRFWTRRIRTSHAVLKGAGPKDDPARARSAAPAQAAQLNVPLVLSGHTHGGQVLLPASGRLRAANFPTLAGWREDQHVAVRQPRGRNGLRAGANQLSARSGGHYTALNIRHLKRTKPPPFDAPAAIEHELNRFGIDAMLLDENPRRQRVDGVVVQHGHTRCRTIGPASSSRGDEVHGRARRP